MAEPPKSLGKYQVLGVLGRGGMGEVFKAFQPDLNRPVAIKTLIAGEHASAEFLERFQREARMAAKLVHPNIVQIHDIAAEGPLHYIVMEYVEGRSLKQICTERRLEVDQCLKIAHTIARALQFAHAQKIIHRDIKPANVLIDKQGRVRILDFGLAKSLGDEKGLTGSGAVVGTPHYMAPEQAFGAPEEVDGRADVYSLGATLYELVTGRPPFDAPTVLGILRAIETDDPKPPGVSPAVDALILKALEKTRERRFSSAAEMADAIKACLAGSSAERTTQVTPPARRSRIPVVAAAGGALLLGLLVWIVWPDSKEADPAPAPDPEKEIRGLVAAGAFDKALEKMGKDRKYRRLRADIFLKRAQYTRAAAELDGRDRLIAELASAPNLIRFFSMGLFLAEISEPPESLRKERLVAAVLAYVDDKPQNARENLKVAAANNASPAHVLLVRAHLDLWEFLADPANEDNLKLLAALRGELDKSEEPYLLALRAVAALCAKDMKSAWAAADRLLSLAPASAETFVLRALLFLHDSEGAKPDQSERALEEAEKLEGGFDAELVRICIRWYGIAAGDLPDEKEWAEMRRALDERLKSDDPPAALFFRAVQNALESRWDDAAADLKKMKDNHSLDRIYHEGPVAAFSWDAPHSRSQLLACARDLQAQLGRPDDAIRTAELIKGDDLEGDQRKSLLRDNQLQLARLRVEDEPKAMAHLRAAVELGANLEELKNDPVLAELVKKYEK